MGGYSRYMSPPLPSFLQEVVVSMFYAGIGSRDTPEDILQVFVDLGATLARAGHVLRSGHAAGADIAFEHGCSSVGGTMEIYLPWSGFNDSSSTYILKPGDGAAAIARQFHPAYDRLSQGAAKLQARNSYQVLGYTLDNPSSFILCWTPGGQGQGGTGQAIRIARHYNIPIFDFGIPNTLARFERFYERKQSNEHGCNS